MDLRFTAADEQFRAEVRDWLEIRLSGPFRELRGRGGPGDEDSMWEERCVWEREMARDRWTCTSWPTEYGGRGSSLVEEVIFHEEYARANAPGRLGHIGETLLGPTLIALGTPDQKARFLPPIQATTERWCQGYSEPEAGSDLANVQCRAERDGNEWVIHGQKTWTSLAATSDWCFALCRTDREVPRHQGISYLLVPMRQPGIEIRPIRQITGTSEFAEVFFDGARTAVDHVVGPVNGGWKVAMATLAFERGASTLGQQLLFANELNLVIEAAKQSGAATDPVLRQRLVDAWIGLKVMRLNALRVLTGPPSRAALVTKLHWATWHRELGKLAMDVLGSAAEVAPAGPDYPLDPLQRLFLWARCDTIYAGSNQIQREIISERGLGLPRENR